MHSEQAFYYYPLLSVSNKDSNTMFDSKTHSIIINEYNWRFNTTSRFYFELGNQLVNSHLIMKFSTMEGNKEINSVLAKQR